MLWVVEAEAEVAVPTVAVAAALSQAWRLGIAWVALAPALQRRQERQLAAQFEQAYRNTDYITRVATLRIAERCPSMDALLRADGLETAVFLTAWNPRSQTLSKRENRRRNARMLERLHELDHHRVFTGEGRGRAGRWTPERSFLVLGMSRRDAKRLAEEFEQNAYVEYTAGGRAKLIWSRYGGARPPARVTGGEGTGASILA